MSASFSGRRGICKVRALSDVVLKFGPRKIFESGPSHFYLSHIPACRHSIRVLISVTKYMFIKNEECSCIV